jgi:hypothetical protein
MSIKRGRKIVEELTVIILFTCFVVHTKNIVLAGVDSADSLNIYNLL